jgi:hypothetical protein
MQPRRPMSPGGQKSDLHQPKAENQPQGQVSIWKAPIAFLLLNVSIDCGTFTR